MAKFNLSDKEIRAEIFKRLGLDINLKADKKIYKQRYDVFRNRIRNYNEIMGTSFRPNEELLRILRKEDSGIDLSNRQKAFLNTSSASIKSFRANLGLREKQGILFLEEEFRGFLNSGNERELYEAWLNESITQYVNVKTGEIFVTPLNNNPDIIENTFLRRDFVTAQELKTYLTNRANDLHARQLRVFNANKAKYNYNLKNVGS